MSQNERRTARAKYWVVVEVERLCKKGLSVNAACEAMGVSQTSFRRWRDRLKTNPEYKQREAIEMDSPRPICHTRQVSASTRQRVIEEAQNTQHTSASSITRQLRAEGIAIGTAKVIEVLEEEGLYGMIQVRDSKGGVKRKRGLLRLCQKRQQGLRTTKT